MKDDSTLLEDGARGMKREPADERETAAERHAHRRLEAERPSERSEKRGASFEGTHLRAEAIGLDSNEVPSGGHARRTAAGNARRRPRLAGEGRKRDSEGLAKRLPSAAGDARCSFDAKESRSLFLIDAVLGYDVEGNAGEQAPHKDGRIRTLSAARARSTCIADGRSGSPDSCAARAGQ